MKYLRNEKGFAMVFVLILAAIALAMTLAMLIMVSRGSYVSGQQKRFRTAVEAGRGGMEAMFQLISNRGNPDPTLYTILRPTDLQAINWSFPLRRKLGGIERLKHLKCHRPQQPTKL